MTPNLSAPTVDVAAIRARLANIHPGPWRAFCGTSSTTADWYVEGARGYAVWDDHGSAERCDAEFIAAARADVPALCDEVASLRARVAALEAEREGLRAALKAGHEMIVEASYAWDADQDSKVGKMLCALAGDLPKYDRRATVFVDAARDAGRARGEG